MSAPDRSFIDPVTLGAPRLTAREVERWRGDGFALVDGLLPLELISQAAADAHAAFPAQPPEGSPGGFGSGQRFVFPGASNAHNALTLHPAMLAAVASLLDVPMTDLRLTQSDLWPKWGRAADGATGRNDDQRIHCDYPNHTLTHPPPWASPAAVEVIVYLSDVDACDGATALVAREGPEDPAYRYPIVDTPGVGDFPYIDDRAGAEAWLREHAPETAAFRAEHLYPRERYARYRPGTVLLYRHDLWHRGTPMRPGALRLAINLTYKRFDADYAVLHAGWPWANYRPGQPLERLIAGASIEQRAVLGFPAPGDRFWTAELIDAVEARYGLLGMDVSAYRAALGR